MEGDDYHPKSNYEKMAKGTPLTDEDRRPWLDALRRLIEKLADARESAVLTCSALKQSYRDQLAGGHPEVVFIYLRGNFELIRSRLRKRKGHFVPASLLPSQFQTLQEPVDAIAVDVAADPQSIVDEIRKRLKDNSRSAGGSGRNKQAR